MSINIKNILILALAIKIIIFLIFLFGIPIFIGDDITSNNSAIHLLNYHNFVLPDCLDQVRTPGYQIFVAFIYLFGINNYSVLIIQNLISLATIYLIYLIGKNLYSEKSGLISALIASALPDFLIQSNMLYTETLFIFLLLYSFYLLISNRIIFSFIVLSLGCYVRPVLLCLPIIFAIYLIILKYNLIKISIGLILFYSIISIWCFRNYKEYGYFRFSAMEGISIYGMTVNNYTPNNPDKADSAFNALGIEKSKTSGWKVGFKENEILMKESEKYLLSHKVYFIKELFYNFYHLHFDNCVFILTNNISPNNKGCNYLSKKHSLAYLMTYFAIWLYNITLLVLIYYFALYAILYDRNLIVMIIVYFLILTVISSNWAGYRHRMPLLPFYIILAGSKINSFFLNNKWMFFNLG